MSNVSSVSYALNGIAAFLGLPMFLRIAADVMAASSYAGRDKQLLALLITGLLLGGLLLLLRKPISYLLLYAVATVAYLTVAVADGSIRSAPPAIWLLPLIVLLIAVGAIFSKSRTTE